MHLYRLRHGHSWPFSAAGGIRPVVYDGRAGASPTESRGPFTALSLLGLEPYRSDGSSLYDGKPRGTGLEKNVSIAFNHPC